MRFRGKSLGVFLTSVLLSACVTNPGMEAFHQQNYQGAFDYFKNEGVGYNKLIGDFYELSSEQKNLDATYFLGVIYMERGRQKLKRAKSEARHAFGLHQQRMITENARDKLILAALENGQEEFVRDVRKADDYFSAAAEQGHIAAINAKGLTLISLPDGDNEQAADWFTLSAEKGYAPARNNLAVMYYYGEDVKRDLGRAKLYFDMAKKQGNLCAESNLQKIQQPGSDALIVNREIEEGLNLALNSRCFARLKSKARSPLMK